MDLCRVEIDLKALRHNFKEIKKRAGKNVKICGVVKDNAYGHGIIEVSKTLVKEEIDFLAVAGITDAVLLRNKGIKIPVLNLVSILPENAKEAVKFDISQSVSDISTAKILNDEAKKKNKTARIHIKVDTGLGRMGILPEDFKETLKEILKLKNIKIEGIFTHFSSADTNKKYTQKQIKIFNKIIRYLDKEILNNKIIKHAANSPTVLGYKNACFDMVRPGLILYGLYPFEKDRKKMNLKPVLSWKTKVLGVRKLKKGSFISYGNTYRTKTDTKIAILGLGYSDGFARLLSNNYNVIIRDKKFPVAGRVCMDLTMVNIGKNTKIAIGDEVILIGKSKSHRLTCEYMGEQSRTIAHEVVCRIRKDIKRYYGLDN